MQVFVKLATGKVVKHKGTRLVMQLPKDAGSEGRLVVGRLVGQTVRPIKTYEAGEWSSAKVIRAKKPKRVVAQRATAPPGLRVSHLVH